MKLITELQEEVQYVTEESKEGQKNLFIEGVFLQGNIKNRNGRVYPSTVLENEVSRYSRDHISKNRAYGELGHPQGPTINLERAAIMIKSLKLEGNNYIGKALVTNTPMGNIVRGLIGDGANLGVSSRGMGTIKENRGIMEVQNDFFLATAADIVADPSAPDAFVNGIMEGVEYWFDDAGRLQKEIIAAQAIKQVEESVRSRSLDSEMKLKIFENYLNSLVSKL